MGLNDTLRRISVFRLMLYYLLGLWVVSGAFMLTGLLPYRAADFVFSTLLILAVCWMVNEAFARAFGARSSLESVLITGLILALIITPMAPGNFSEIGFAIFASAWAMASKFIFAFRRRHIFNPAAFGAALAAISLGASVSWWIGGSLYLLPLVIGGGILILRKIPSLDMLLAFTAATILTMGLASGGPQPWPHAIQYLLHSMFFFFAFVMLTEPRTAPQGRWRRIAYAAIIGFFFAPQIHLGGFYTTPEIALLIGNCFALLMDSRRFARRSAPA